MKKWIALFFAMVMMTTTAISFAEAWTCSNCGTENNGKFCSECGTAALITWICNECSTENSGKFCTECGNPKPDPASVQSKDEFPVGSTVVFGRYEQDNQPANGQEPIEWYVIDTDPSAGKIMLLSRYSLDAIAYGSGECTWETSSIREWLNQDFIQSAFTSEEQGAILNTAVDNSSAQGHSTFVLNGGNDTVDKIFLLSCTEADRYLAGDARKAYGTQYTVNRGAYRSNDFVDWWLRSPGSLQSAAARMGASGRIADYFVSNAERTVRPALWVESKALSSTDTDPVGNVAADANYLTDEQIEQQQKEDAEKLSFRTSAAPHVGEADLSAIRIGDYVQIGNYEQDGDATNGAEPLEWLVLDKQDGKLLLITKHIIERKRYNENFTATTWADCSLRAWLNLRFINFAFSDQEQRLICRTMVDDSQKQQASNDTRGGYDTEDSLFVLSCAESQFYFDTDEARQCSATPYTKAKGIYVSDGSWFGGEGNSAWWLRSPGIKDQNYVLLIEASGGRDGCGVHGEYGVRPAMWVQISR